MFKKIVSNLPFSPALVGQLGFYAKRLKKEEATRRLGLVFLALTLIVQSFAVFQPPESANASSETDMVTGGISSKSDYLKAYDANSKHLQDTMNYVGITRHEIAISNYTTFKAGDKLSWGFAPRFSYSQGERIHPIFNKSGTRVTTAYSRPLRLWGNSSMQVEAWVGHSARMGWFAIMKSCGNLVTDKLPTPVEPDYSCDDLTAKLISGNQYRFSGSATAKNGASIKNYEFNFGDNSAKKTTINPMNVLHTYATGDATYTARLSINLRVNGVEKTVTSNACKVTITVSKPPVNPVYTCDSLSAELVGKNQYKFNGKATATNGATVKNYLFNFGDNVSKTVTNPTSVMHTYAVANATYTTVLNVTFNVNGSEKTVTSEACKIKITVSQPPTPQPCLLNPNLLATDENCKPCPGNITLWINDESCIPNIVQSKTATNTSQGFVDATTGTAHSSDQISYTITIENTGLSPKTVKLEDHLGDVLEYSTLIDNGGGSFNDSTKVLSWSDATLAPKEKQTRTFVVKLMDVIPATASGASDPTSFDCVMTNIFGNSTNINVDCPTPKIVENVAKELPHTGPTENIIFSGIIFAITTYFYVRTRQVKREVQLIRKDVGTGTL